MLQAGAGTALPPARRSRTLQQKCTSPRLVILGALIKFVLLPPRLSSAAGHDVARGVVRESLAIMRVRLNAIAAVAGFVPRNPRCLVPVRLIGPGHCALFPAGPERRDRDQSGQSDTGAGGCSAGEEARRYAPQLSELPDGCEHPAAFHPRPRKAAKIASWRFFFPVKVVNLTTSSRQGFCQVFGQEREEVGGEPDLTAWNGPTRSVGQTRRRRGSFMSATRRCVTVPSTPCARK